jgi:CRISPR-associated protein Cmr6
MESEKGKIIIRKSKKGKSIFEVDIGGKKPMTIPNFYELKDETLNNKECLVFREKGQIKKITIDEKELPKKEKEESKPKKYNQPKQKQGYKIKDSFDITKTKIPKNTREILKDFKYIDNFHLKLNRFSKFDEDKGYKLQNQNISETFFNKNWNFYQSKITNYYEEIQQLNLNFSNLIKLKTDYRLLIGSEQSIYETSIRLHHIYGIPYIPSSAIKGVVRSYFIEKYFYDEENNEQEALKDDDFKNYFGTQEQEGKIIFFDAFPISQPKIKVDIMNPHYGHYYNDGEAPTDTKNPIPINFLTIEDTIFQFLIGFKDEVDSGFIGLFKEALTNHGIGAKTAVGYGYFA